MMELTITQERMNTNLGRKRVVASLMYSGQTPEREQVRDALQSHVAGGNIIIRSIDPRYGRSEASVAALIYEDEAVMRSVEQEYMVDRNVDDETPDTAEDGAHDEPGDDTEEAEASSEE